MSNDKPTGQWRCRACGTIWEGSQLFRYPEMTAQVWTCGNLLCGGTCDPVPVSIPLPPALDVPEMALVTPEEVDELNRLRRERETMLDAMTELEQAARLCASWNQLPPAWSRRCFNACGAALEIIRAARPEPPDEFGDITAAAIVATSTPVGTTPDGATIMHSPLLAQAQAAALGTLIPINDPAMKQAQEAAMEETQRQLGELAAQEATPEQPAGGEDFDVRR